MIRIGFNTPCAIDPEGFSCVDCDVGWLPHCRFRTDEDLRGDHAATWRTRSSVPDIDSSLAVAIERVAVDVMTRQQIAMPAQLVHSCLPPSIRHIVDAETVGGVLTWSLKVFQSSPGMFRPISHGDIPDLYPWQQLRPSTGVALNRELLISIPDNGRAQAAHFKRLAAQSVALSFSRLDDGERRLGEAIDSLRKVILAREPWSVSDLVDVAVGLRTLPPRYLELPDPERSQLFASIFAFELIKGATPTQLSDDWHCLWSHLLTSNARLVAYQARRFAGGGFLRFGDLYQEGFFGLMRAVTKFDPYRGFAFSTYATPWIQQAIRRAMADCDRTVRLPVHMVEKVQLIQSTKARLRKIGRRADARAVARELGPMSPADVVRVEAWSQAIVPLDREVLCQLYEVELADELDALELRATLAKHVNVLPLTQRRVLDLRFGLTDGVPRTLEDVGHFLGVTRERVRQLEGKALKQLRSDLVIEPGRQESAETALKTGAVPSKRPRRRQRLVAGGPTRSPVPHELSRSESPPHNATSDGVGDGRVTAHEVAK